jgi:hypothetical protein
VPDEVGEVVEETPTDDEIVEEWSRRGTCELCGVFAWKRRVFDDFPWRIGVDAMEAVREEPLESEIRRKIADAIAAVPGVTDFAEEDREVWAVGGAPKGPDLVRAVGRAVDTFRDRLQDYL